MPHQKRKTPNGVGVLQEDLNLATSNMNHGTDIAMNLREKQGELFNQRGSK